MDGAIGSTLQIDSTPCASECTRGGAMVAPLVRETLATPICNVLPIAPSTYHDPRATRAAPMRPSDRARQDAALRPEIRRVFEENWSVYVLDHSQNKTVAASRIAEKKVSGHRSYRVATRLQSLRRPNMISMRLRRL